MYTFLVVMNDYEREFEECKNDLESRLSKSEKAKPALQTKLDRVDSDKQEYKRDADKYEL